MRLFRKYLTAQFSPVRAELVEAYYIYNQQVATTTLRQAQGEWWVVWTFAKE